MSDGKMIGVNIPIQGDEAGGFWKVGEAEIDDNLFLLEMDRGWTDLLAGMVRNGAQIEGISINVRFRAAERKEN